MSQVTSVVDQVGPGVVGVRWGKRRGSGVVVAPDRVVVLRHASSGPVELTVSGQSARTGELVGSDRRNGLAVLAVPTGEIAAPGWAESAPSIGDGVFALANPAGTGLRATEGRVSSDPLTIRGRHGGTVEGVIEHTAPLPRGAGGGPLVDSSGALVGLNVLRSDPGLILALPSAVVRPLVERIIAGQAPSPRLGVALAPGRASRRMRAAVGLPERDGLIVRFVEDGTPAQTAGVQPGDLLVALGESELSQIQDVFGALEGAEDSAVLRVVRGTEELELAVSFSAAEPT